MTAPDINPVELKVFLNHIYEYKKGVRQMVLYTTNRKYEAFAVNRLKSQRIKFVIQPVDEERINLFFGKAECINAIRLMVTRPLNLLTPEEDFILGAMLGYDICAQCKRYCTRKARRSSICAMFFSSSLTVSIKALFLSRILSEILISEFFILFFTLVTSCIPLRKRFSNRA